MHGYIHNGLKMQNRWVSLILAGCFTLPCYAKTFETSNTGGGKIVLTDRECQGFAPLKKAYAYISSGLTVEGCWGYIDNKVHVYYPELKEKRIYNPSEFTEIPTY